MQSIMVKFVCTSSLIYLFTPLHYVACDTIGGISPEKWNDKCREHFYYYGEEEAPHVHIYIPGYCERYYCQQYGHEMYGVTTEECKKVTIHRASCRIIAKRNKEYPFCCPQLECDRRKPKMVTW